MVSKELEQLLNGGQGYRRARAPEPLLLPRIATRIAPESLGFAGYMAGILSRRWSPCAWPALADATAVAIASRHMELDDRLLRDVYGSLPQLALTLLGLGEEAGQRVDTLVGSDAAQQMRTGLGSPDFIFRETVKRVFNEPDPPRSAEELMAFVQHGIEADNSHNQRNLLAYFLPLVTAEHRQWLTQRLLSAPGIYPGLGWSVAAAASRIAGLLDQAAIENFVASLEMDDAYWVGHARELLAGGPAASVFLEVARALPCDGRLERLLSEETDLAALAGFLERILDNWGGAPAPAMAAAGMEPGGIDDGAREPGPEGAGPALPASRGLGSGNDAGAEEALPEPPGWTRSAPPPAPIPMPPPAAVPMPPAAPVRPIAPSTLPERTLQTQVYADDGGAQVRVTQGFRKGARHDVRLWIGPQTKHAIRADRPLAEPVPDDSERQQGHVEIVITLVHESVTQARAVKLPVDRSKPGEAADFSLQVAQDAMFVSAEVWLQHKGRVIQYLKLNGLVLEDPDSITGGIVLKSESVVRALPADASGSDFGLAMVKKDNRYIVFGPRGAEKTEVSLQGSRELVEKINARLFNATKGLVRHSADGKGTSWVEDGDEEAMQLLREMARWGNALYDALKKEGALERISETIQFVNLDETDIVPIEYVYDRGYPKDGATLCDGFRDAADWNEIFARGTCTCSNRPQQESGTLCPLGFWSLSKIIERQPRPRGAAGTDPAAGFIASSPAGPGIALTRQAVLAAAPNVNGLDVESIRSLLRETYQDRHTFAPSWEEWKSEIKTKSPKLLILLPHHGEASSGHTDFLEIGEPGQASGSRLRAGNLNEDFVTGRPDEPGPIVLLLGCETAQAGLLPFHTFARDFLANRASVVVATQCSVLGQHAAPVANEFIRQLLAASHAQGSFGRIMRDVRRRMFAAGYLMSLALVSFGDSDWKLENAARGDNHV